MNAAVRRQLSRTAGLFARIAAGLVVTAALAVLLIASTAPVAALTATTADNSLPITVGPASVPALPTLDPTLPSPISILPTPTGILPSPGLPTPSPSLPVPTPQTPPPSTLSPSPPALAVGAGTDRGGSSNSGDPPRGLQIPLTPIVLREPLDVALATALAVLPLSLGLWLLLFGRTLARARQLKDGRLRLALAADLGLTPRELESLSTEALFKLRDRAAFDELTGVLRRAAGIAATQREMARARRDMRPLSVVFVDVDGLKQTNDRRGHRAGDELLRNLAAALREGLRGQDLIFRYGGDEFVCVLPETDVEAARQTLAAIQTTASERLDLSFCAGFAQMKRGDDVVNLLARADRDLYAAKGGRNRERESRSSGQARGERPVVV